MVMTSLIGVRTPVYLPGVADQSETGMVMTSLIGVRTPPGVRTPYYIKRAITIVITIKMNSCEQVFWAKSLNVDEVVP